MQKDGVLFSFHYVLPKYSTTGSIVFIDNLKLQADKASSGGDTESTLLDEDFDDYEGGLPVDWSIANTNKDAKYTWKVKKSYSRVLASCDADTYDDSYNNGGWGANSGDITVKNGREAGRAPDRSAACDEWQNRNCCIPVQRQHHLAEERRNDRYA